MTLKKYLILMSSIALICWVGFVFVINQLNPMDAGMLGYFLFYSILFLATVATLSVFGFMLRSRLLQGELTFKQVAITFRQALWFGILVIASLWMQSRTVLTWWNMLLLIIVLSVLEFFFLSLKRTRN